MPALVGPNPHRELTLMRRPWLCLGGATAWPQALCQNQPLEYVMGELWTRTKLAFAAFFTILFKGRLPAAA